MTSVQRILKQHKISTYKLVQTMGISPTTHHQLWASRISGKTMLDRRQLDKLKKALHVLIGDVQVDVEQEAVRFKIK